MKQAEIDLAVEASRETFEENAWIKYYLSMVESDAQHMTKPELLARNAEGDYAMEYLQTLWIGWKWCYSVCKVPVK